MMTKSLFVDTETTGLDPVKNDVIQIAGIIEIDNQVKEEFDFKVRPFDINAISQEALDINGYSIDQIKEFPKQKKTYLDLVTLFGKYINKFDKNDKFTPIGYNVGFDLSFLKQFFLKNNDPFWGSWVKWHKVDPMYIIHFLSYTGKIKLPDHSLVAACNHFGIEIKAHDALSDIRATRKLLTILTEGKY